MFEFIYLPLILIIYFRTWKFHRLIDDPVPRDGYLYEGPRHPKPSYYDQRKSILATVTNIGVYMAVCGYVHYLFGWKVALLFALIPTNVGSVAWTTGNYYASTLLLVLAATMCLGQTATMPLDVAELPLIALYIVGAGCFYGAALNSTVNSLAFIFVAPFLSPYGWTMIVPLIFFLRGKRFTIGMKKRKERHLNINVKSKFTFRNLINTPKVLAFYIYMHLWPSRLGFFYSWGRGRKYFSTINLIACCILCLEWWYIGLCISPLMIWWYFTSLIIFCHVMGHYGQFVTVERYSVIATVPFVFLLNSIIDYLPNNEIIYTIVCCLYFAKSYTYTKAWRTNETLFTHSMESQYETPENFNNLGNYYIDHGRLGDAVRPLQVAEVLTEGDKFRVYASLMKCYFVVRNYGKALEYCEKALASNYPKDQYQGLLQCRSDINNKIVAIRKHRKILKKHGII